MWEELRMTPHELSSPARQIWGHPRTPSLEDRRPRKEPGHIMWLPAQWQRPWEAACPQHWHATHLSLSPRHTWLSDRGSPHTRLNPLGLERGSLWPSKSLPHSMSLSLSDKQDPSKSLHFCPNYTTGITLT